MTTTTASPESPSSFASRGESVCCAAVGVAVAADESEDAGTVAGAVTDPTHVIAAQCKGRFETREEAEAVIAKVAAVVKAHADIMAVVKTPDVTKQLMSQGVQIVGMNPAQFATHLRAEIKKWAGIAKQANMQDIQAN